MNEPKTANIVISIHSLVKRETMMDSILFITRTISIHSLVKRETYNGSRQIDSVELISIHSLVKRETYLYKSMYPRQ